ncbi:hypothetical protein Pan189_32740 [Stratiformator vulcanicus]|uniref:Uncharacterized protein n=1 Tax=Stratiformator vulcanicus TaxID=2527980 RepID=A0A517R4S6_9PLAN|nr:hypothetical protein Pan189_32740 [Stratiformator vulcanicus]
MSQFRWLPFGTMAITEWAVCSGRSTAGPNSDPMGPAAGGKCVLTGIRTSRLADGSEGTKGRNAS